MYGGGCPVVVASRADAGSSEAPIVRTPPATPSPRPRKRHRPAAAMPSRAECYSLPPPSSSPAQPPTHPPAYPTSPSVYPGHSAVLYLTSTGPWPVAEQNHPPAHHRHTCPHTAPPAGDTPLPADWQKAPLTFAQLYRSLDAPVPGIDAILERNRLRLEGDMWADYPAAGEYARV